MPETKSYETVAANVAAVRERMAQAAKAAGRDPGEITLVAATKVQTSETIRNAIRAGITVCGENRVQELVAHLEDNAYEGAKVHFIGHLQTNKVKFVVGKVDMIESIDSVRLMDAVEKQAAKVDVTQDILLEVNIGDEESKGGAAIDEILALAQRFPYLHFIAWDVIKMPDGKNCVIEANTSSGVNIVQLWGGQRHGELGDFYRAHGVIK